ncbi:MAG: hypothetical protein H7293_02065 [Candidatus Saccharibacteria bacterium]|nr:hypothetical protein [Rhodoferax sp.]
MAVPDLSECVSAGFAGLKNNPVNHIVASLLVVFISSVGFGLLTGPMMVGYMKMIKIEDEGGKAEIADVFKGFDDFVPALLAVLVGSIIVAIGYIFCILPGLLLMAIVPTAAYLVACGEKDGISALKRAWEAVKPNLLSAFFCMLVLGILGNLGLILCFVGVIFTLPIAFIGSYHMAKQLTDGGNSGNLAITVG